MTTLTLACGAYDRARPILNGRVQVEGATIVPVPLASEQSFPRAVSRAEFDVSELSLSSHLLQVSRGQASYVALPIFISRAFRHGAIYLRAGAGIASPRDLEGRLVGIPEYQMTLGLWVRGILADDHGVDVNAIRYRTAGTNKAGRKERLPLELPDDMDVAPLAEGDTLNAALLRGELDAIFSPTPPDAFATGDPRVIRLFPDTKAAEIAFHRRTGFHPIMHVIGVRAEILARDTGLGRRLLDAFEAAKRIAIAEMDAMTRASAPPLMLPWHAEAWAETRAELGDDPWPYGIDANRVELEAILRWSHDQHLSRRRLTIEEVFDPGTLES
ncbi:ABC transporter substrate-binding protein [Muricoccus radiodurans]|uniref:ABC transporter substrate-binding protein n=1 Tax=Muricoccus radiodurans TaxID=2231721 RepID=UPI003CF29E4F